MITPQKLHEWYLEATRNLPEGSFNKNAQIEYESLSSDQKFIDEYIAEKINQEIDRYIEIVEQELELYE